MISLPTTSLASLLPQTALDWLGSLPSVVLILITIACLTLVIKGADWLVEAAATVAKKIGMPEVIIGATIVSLGTTAPETAVSVLAAFSGNAGLALGNGVGSIIADTGLIFGVGLLLTRLPADRFVLNRQGWVQFGSAVLLCAICYGLFAQHGKNLDENGLPVAQLPRIIGVLFLLLLAGYLFLSVLWSKQHNVHTQVQTQPVESSEDNPSAEVSTEANDEFSEGPDLSHAAEKSLFGLFGLGLVGLIAVIGGGDTMVSSVTVLAERAQIPNSVIAGTLVAFGTSLPELVVGITAIRKKHPELLVGNVIGADILNVLFVIGAACVASPLPILDPGGFENGQVTLRSMALLYVQLPTMLLLLFIMRGYIFKASKQGHFDRWMGIPMVAIYVGFVIASFFLASSGSGH